MQFLHSREYLNDGEVVIVNCSHQCNIMLMDDLNFQNYRSGRNFKYHGGFYRMLPARIAAPTTGFWNVVLDLGGGSANIKYSITVAR